MTEESCDIEDLVEMLRRRAASGGERVCFRFLDPSAPDEPSLTYAELDRRARAIGAALARRTAPGDRAVLLYPPGLDYPPAYFGCLYGGLVAVPSFPPRRRGGAEPIRRLLEDSGAALLLTSRALADRVGQLAAELGREGDVVVTDELPLAAAEGWRPPVVAPDAPAHLQYTSGSTGDPKGVVITHANLLHNLRTIREAFGVDASSKAVVWLPPQHDMGLVGGLLGTLYAGMETVLLSPASFYLNPFSWLSAVSRFRAGASGGPDTAFAECVRRISPEQVAELDLSCWKIAFCGAEPVRPETLERFAETFAPAGFRREAFYPCYGLAEATLMVAGGELDRPPATHTGSDGRQRLANGDPRPGLEVRLVDPESRRPLAEGEVGEIWVRGPSVAAGYWGKEEASRATFEARLADGEGPYLRTGDLGYLAAGELYVTGRLKDLVIVRGRNHHPEDLERTAAASHPSLEGGGCCAFSVEGEGGERLVLVHEVPSAAARQLDEIASAVRLAVAQEHELPVEAVVLIRQRTLPRTASGKVRRKACREAYRGGELAVLGESRRTAAGTAAGAAADEEPADLLERLRRWVAAETGRPVADLPADRGLDELGVESLALANLKLRAERELGVELPLGELVDGPPLAELAARIEALQETSRPSGLPAARAGEDGGYALSPGQRGLWVTDRMIADRAAYNIVAAARLPRAPDGEVLSAALAFLVARHESLRTSFPHGERGPVARIHPSAEVDFAELDVSTWSAAREEQELDDEVHRPFDLEAGPLLRVRLYRRVDGARLLLVVHHIVADFLSLAILARELDAAYGALLGGERPVLPPLPLRYVDFAAWQRELTTAAAGEAGWEHWRRTLAEPPPALEIEPDPPGARGLGGAGATTEILAAGAPLGAALDRFSQERGVTPFTVLLAVFQLLLHRWAGCDDLAVGVPLSGRTRAAFAPLVGYFVNPLPLRSRLAPGDTFADLLGRTARALRGALAHQELPFPALVERLAPERDSTRTPFYQVMFNLLAPWQESGGEGARSDSLLGGLRPGELLRETLGVEQRVSQFDLEAVAVHDADGLTLLFRFDTARLHPDTGRRLVASYQTLLEAALREPERLAFDLPLLPAEDAEGVASLPPGPVPEAVERPFSELFAEAVDRFRGAPAASCRGTTLTYGELAARVDRLAAALARCGCGPEGRVALLLPRGLDFLVGKLAALAAGAAFLPLEVGDPPARLAAMIRGCGSGWVLTREGVEVPVAGTAAGATDGVVVTVLPEARAGTGTAGPDHLAYVLFTSGSTGTPKGAMVVERGMVNHLLAKVGDLGLTVADAVAQTALPSFDIAVWQHLAVLLAGGRVHIVGDEAVRDPEELVAEMARGGVTVLEVVPSMLRLLLDHALDGEAGRRAAAGLRWLLATGEALEPELARRWLERFPGVPLVNAYGPAECSDDVTHHVFDEPPAEGAPRVPVGRPLAGTGLHVLDPRGGAVPCGVVGEIAVGGVGVGRGYAGDPRRTAAVFGPDPFSRVPGARLYRTGDLGFLRPDGVLEFCGRVDQQLKIRGMRVEAGEVEAALYRHPEVAEAAVVASEAPDGRQLVAFVVLRQDGEEVGGASRVDEEALLRFLAAELPGFMVPSRLAILDRLPLNANGKVDRRRLATLVAGEGVGGGPAAPPAPPRTPAEERISAVWREVLGHGSFGVFSDFFRVGGDSMRAVELASALRRAGIAARPQLVFEHRTVARQAAAFAGGAAPVRAVPEPFVGEAPLTPIQERYFALEPADPQHWAQAISLVSEAPLDSAALERALGTLVRQHDALRLSFPPGADGVRRAVYPPPAGEGWPVTALPDAGGEAAAAAVDRAAAAMDLDRGPLFAVLRAPAGDGGERLWLVAHHLVVDALSWRILAEDLADAYGQAVAGRASLELPAGSASFGAWAEELAARAASEEVRAEADLWRGQLTADRVPVDVGKGAGGADTVGSAEVVRRRLPAAATRSLLDLERAGAGDVRSFLVTAVAAALRAWTGRSEAVVALEGHGREGGFGERDLARTVGFLTTLFPVRVAAPREGGLAAELVEVERALEALPRGGVGYGLLRSRGELPADLPEPEVVLDYLGRHPRALRLGPFTLELDRLRVTQSPAQPRWHPVEVTAVVLEEELALEVSYSRERHRGETAEAFADRLVETLERLGERYTADPLATSRDGGPRGRRAACREVLLTGGTGLLGAWLSHLLLERTGARVHALVRAPSEAAAAGRLRDTREGYFPGAEEPDAGRLVALPGDLAQPRLGLSEETWESLGGEVDAIVHAGAEVVFWGGGSRLDGANVTGTRQVLGLLGGEERVLHHVSTLAVLGVPEGTEPLSEGDFGRGQRLTNTYARSKFLAELLVREAMGDGARAAVHRVGLIGPDSVEGAFRPVLEKNALFRYLRALARGGVAPDLPDLPLEIVPVDFVAAAIVELVLEEGSPGHTFHLRSRRPVTHGELVEAMRQAGYRLHLVPPFDLLAMWRQAEAAGVTEPDVEATVASLEDFGLLPAPGEEPRVPRYDSALTERWLASSGLEPPELGVEWLVKVVESARRAGFLPQPGSGD